MEVYALLVYQDNDPDYQEDLIYVEEVGKMFSTYDAAKNYCETLTEYTDLFQFDCKDRSEAPTITWRLVKHFPEDSNSNTHERYYYVNNDHVHATEMEQMIIYIYKRELDI